MSIYLHDVHYSLKKKKKKEQILALSQEWWCLLRVPVTAKVEQEDHTFKASLGNLERLSKTNKQAAGMVVYASNSSIPKAVV